MRAYADTSFLVSLYILDANSAFASTQMESATLPVLIMWLAEVELENALCLRLVRKELVRSETKAARALFSKDVREGIFEVKNLSNAAFERARRLARKHTPRLGTRTFDVLHVASALELAADTFYSFDRDQQGLARAERLTIP